MIIGIPFIGMGNEQAHAFVCHLCFAHRMMIRLTKLILIHRKHTILKNKSLIQKHFQKIVQCVESHSFWV